MRALSFQGPYSVKVVDKPDPRIEHPQDGIVRVTTADTHRPYYMGFTRTVSRPRSLARDRAIVLGEAPAGAPRPIAAWFPTDGGDGHEFIY